MFQIALLCLPSDSHTPERGIDYMSILFLTTCSCLIAAFYKNVRESSDCQADSKITKQSSNDVIRPYRSLEMPAFLVSKLVLHCLSCRKFPSVLLLSSISLTFMNAGLFVFILRRKEF